MLTAMTLMQRALSRILEAKMSIPVRLGASSLHVLFKQRLLPRLRLLMLQAHSS